MNKKYFDQIYYQGTDLWPSFIGKSIFVVGRTGFYGGWFDKFFAHLWVSGYNVCFDGGSKSSGLHVLDPKTYPKELKEADYVINASGSSDVGDHWVHAFSALTLAQNCKGKILQISSGSAKNITEKSGTYALCKEFAEKTVAGNKDVQVVRAYNTIGPGMSLDKHFAIPTFIRQKLNGETLSVAPNVVRSFCHITDLIVQMLHVMVLGDGLIYEVGSDDPMSLLDAAKLVSDDVVVTDENFPSNADSNNYVADLTRVKNQFNLDLLYKSSYAVKDTLNWYIEQNKNG